MGAFEQKAPQKISIKRCLCDGSAFLYVALSVEKPELSANLSEERIFSNVFEHRLIINQPVEVRVWPEDLEYHQGKVSKGGIVSFKSSFSQRSRFLQPFNHPLPAAETVLVHVALDII